MTFHLMDASAQLAFARERTFVLNTRVYETLYEDIDYASLITVDTSLPEWASGVDTLVGDMTGKAEWQSGGAKDVPLAEVGLRTVSTQFQLYSIGYQWNVEELGKAQFAGYPLTERKAAAARRGSEEFAWNIVINGDARMGWGGLINNAAITPITLPADGTGTTTAWVSNTGAGLKTAEQIIRDINLLLVSGNIVKDTILLPEAAFNYILATPYGVTSPGMSIMAYLMTNNLYTQRTGRPLTVRSVPQLATAATTGIAGGGRAVAYRNSADNLVFWMPLPYRFLDVYQDGPLNYTVPGISRVGPVDFLQPRAIAYGDAVTQVPA